tara:strand:+ start:530 stop:703 length:174 start_codon:yes stop_codon:yes gene_type:complete
MSCLTKDQDEFYQPSGRFAIVKFYKELLKKGIIKYNGTAHKRLKQLQRRNYEKASKG